MAPQRDLTLRRWIALCLIGLAVLALTALLRGTPEDVSWYAAHTLPAIAVACVCATPSGLRISQLAMMVAAILLPSLVLLTGFGLLDIWGDAQAISLHTENPNLLAADLVVVLLASTALRLRLPWGIAFPATALAIIYTGSRSALLALGLAWIIWLLLPSTPPRTRYLSGIGMLLAAGVLVIGVINSHNSSSHLNLLTDSTTFASRFWDASFAQLVAVERDAMPGPVVGSTADRVTVASDEFTLTLFQSAGTSIPGARYFASVYLRAGSEQEVFISTQLSRSRCVVTSEWSRCVTGPGVGDGSTAAQFRLETATPGGTFDVLAFGPQLEMGNAVSPYTERTPNLFPYELLKRFQSRSSWSQGAEVRKAAQVHGLRAVKGSVLFGHGHDVARTLFTVHHSQGLMSEISHAHNLLVQRLVTDGVVGVIGWIVAFGGIVVVASRRLRHSIAPLLAAVLVLNTLDYTIFHSAGYWSSLVVLGSAWNSERCG